MNEFPFSRTRRFADRADAARQLAEAIADYRGQRPLVLAIARGGVPIGRIVADALDGDLDVILARKLCSPVDCEVAIGAIDEKGNVQLTSRASAAGMNLHYVNAEAARQLAVIRKRRATYSPGRQLLDVAGRVVIVVDDGLATGATMHAALEAVRQQNPAELVAAVPVASPKGLDDVVELADELVCLHTPAHFRAVGAFYQDFRPVDDAQVLRLLNAGARAAAGLPIAEPMSFELPDVRLCGDLAVPPHARGLVIFAHGSGSSRFSPRNLGVARALQRAGLATLLFDLLTPEEEHSRTACFDIANLADRLAAVVAQIRRDPALAPLPLGLFGASTGAGAALAVAAQRPQDVAAVVSRSGRPDLAGEAMLGRVKAPTLLIVGGEDGCVITLNRAAQHLMTCRADVAVVPGATHLFGEPGALDAASALACDWFTRWMSNPLIAPRRRPAERQAAGQRAG